MSDELSPANDGTQFAQAAPDTTPTDTLSRRDLLKTGALAAGVALTGSLLPTEADASPAAQAATPKRIYLAPDDHTDYLWSADEEAYRQAFLDMTDYYLALADSTAGNAPDFQSRWNCDGSFWLWTYEKNKTLTDFETKFIARLRDGHLSIPLTTLVGCYGGVPTEAVLRGLYYAGRIERRYNLRFPLAVVMENQTLPYGLGGLWAGSGAKYSWRGICNCATTTPDAGNREHEIYWWVGQDGSKILMKWHSLYDYPQIDPQYASYYTTQTQIYGGAHDKNESIGGYAEARYPFEVVEFVDTDPRFLAKYVAPNSTPYRVIGAFGQGWDNIETKNNNIVIAAQTKANANRRVIVSNEQDFFQDFEATYGATLPTQSVTFGNEWDTACAAMQEVTASVRRATEKLRAAEALATLVSLQSPGFLNSRTVNVPLTTGAGSYPPSVTAITNPTEARDLAFVNYGLYWEHDFLGGGSVGNDARAAFQRRTAQNIVSYVDGLHADAALALGRLIAGGQGVTRFYAFNPLGWLRTDVADFPYTAGGAVKVVDVTTGLEVPSQRVVVDGQAYLRVLAANIPAVGYKVFEVRAGTPSNYAPAATVTGRTIENTYYKITLADDGAIVSLLDKTRSNREFAAQSPQAGRGRTIRLNDLGVNGGSNFTSTVTVENAGPVSVTLKIVCTGFDVPLDHTTRVTLYATSNRIAIRNDINENFGDTRTYDFGFNLTNPDIWHEELGAIIRAKLTTQGGHYSPRNARYDWQAINHFADISGDGGVGVTLSNADCQFMKVGNSTLDTLDTGTAIVSPLIGGSEFSGISGQNGDSYFLQRFALQTHGTSSPANAMRFALEHQNPLVVGAVTGGTTGYPNTTYSLLTVSDPNVLLWALKPAEEGIAQGVIARLWNLNGAASNFTLTTTPTLTAARQTTHIETDLANLTTNGNAAQARASASQLVTFRLLTASSTPGTTVVRSLNAGGGAVPPFAADSGAVGGNTYTTPSTIITAGVANAAPEAVYHTERYGTFSYKITGLTPGAAYTVRLHFAEIYWGVSGRPGAGQRVFGVAINGATALANLDIYAAVGSANKALVRDVAARADGSGQITIAFTPNAGVPDRNAKVSGIQILS